MQPIKQSFFNTIAEQFDNHVRQSIPLFSECIEFLIKNIAAKGHNVLDICGSTGLMGKKLFDSGFQGQYTNIDGSPQMIDICKDFAKHYTGINPILGGFLASWKDESGINIPQWEHEKNAGKYDFVIESLGFQFFTKERETPIKEMKKLGKYSVFIEKFSNKSKRIFDTQEHLKDTLHKSKYFTPEQIEAKKTNVLADMGEYCYDFNLFRQLLLSNYKHVRMFYKAGNFAGYICSDYDDLLSWYNHDRKLTVNEFNAI